MTDIFIITWGQSDNLGDVILRRHFFDVMRRMGRLCLLTGHDLPDSYLDCLVRSNDETFTDIREWRAEAVRRACRGRVALCEVPSEIVAEYGTARYFLRQSLLAGQLRRRGAPSFLVGLGLRLPMSRLYRSLYRVATRPYGLVGWRDPQTARSLETGFTMPDWAFGIGSAAEDGAAARNTLVVSMRGDRPSLSERAVDAMRTYARRNGLVVRVSVQVYCDAERGRSLAQRLHAEFVQPASDFPALEKQVRDLYRQAHLVVSDRLHVLILAAVEGAPCACLAEYGETKIGRHFDAIGVTDISQCIAGEGIEEISRRMSALSRRAPELRKAVSNAQLDLCGVADAMAREMRGS